MELVLCSLLLRFFHISNERLVSTKALIKLRALMHVCVLSNQGTWIIQPSDLLLNNWIKPIPFFFVLVLRWERPEYFLDNFDQDWIPVIENVHAD